MKKILLPFLLMFLCYEISAQIGAGPATDCTSSIPEICPGGSYPASTTGLANAPGASFSCSVGGTNTIDEQPTFFYFEAGVTGPLTMQIDPTDPFTGAVLFNPQDLDFMCWGPFSSTSTMCNGLTAANLITCSYSPGATEYCFLPNVIAGQFYVILVTNWTQTAPATDCNILFTPDTSLASGGFAGSNSTISLCSTSPPFNLISQLNGTPDGWGVWINSSNNIVDSIFDPSSDAGGVYRYVIGGTATCPGDTAWLTIDLISAATMSITSSSTSCENDSPLTLTALPTGGTFSGNGVSGNIFTPDASIIGSNTIEYLYQANGCSDTITQDFIVYESPYVSASNVTTTNPTCFGDSDGTATVIATGGAGGYTYNWFGQNPAALPSGTFNYEVTDINNCTFTDNVTLFDPINDIGVLTAYNSSCYGSNTGSISITLTNGGNISGTVSDPSLGYCGSSPNSAYISQLTSNISIVTLIGDNITLNNNTTGASDFYEDYTNNTGLPGEYADITEGLSYSVDVTLGGMNAPGAYQNFACGKVFIDFNIDGDFDDTGEEIGIIPWGENTFTSIGFTVPNTGASGPTRMRVVAQYRSDSNPNNIGPCDVGDLGINGEPWFGATEDYSIVLSSASGLATFLWENGQTSDSIYDLGPGTYSVIITPSSGCAVQDQATITESENISFNPTITNVSCNSFTDGMVILSPSGGMDNIYTPDWYGFDPLALDNGTYNLTVTDNFGCSNDTAITISEPAYFSVDFTVSDNEICLNDFVTLNFDFNTGGIPPFSIDYAINGSTQTPISYNNSGILLEPASPILGNNTYVINTITDGAGCEIQNTILAQDIFANPIPDIGIAISGTNPICIGDNSSVFFTNINGTPPYNVAYNINGAFATENVLASGNNLIVNPDITTTYTLDSVADSKGCTNLLNSSATLVVNELPELNWNVPSEVCDQDIVQMNFSFTAGAAPWNVLYDVDGSNYSIPLSNSIDSIAISPTSNSTYTLVTIIDNNNCRNDLNEILTISIYPLPSGEITGGGSICNDGSTAEIIINTNSGTPPYSIIYAYGVNTQLISNASFSEIISSNQIGTYSLVEIADSKGCLAKDLSGTALININPLPEANIIAYPQPANIINPLIYFNDVSSGHIYGIWNFGDGNTNTTNFEELTHIYADTGTYQVSLEVESDSGCFNTAYQTIIISPVFTVYIPNSFTPNNDLYNDYFLPIVDGVSQYEFSVYNRLGERVFVTNKTNVAWDGKVENSDQYVTKGVYLYSLVLTDINGKLRTYEGPVTLIR